METPTKKEGLMFEGTIVPPAKSRLPRILFGFLLIAIIVGSGLFIFSKFLTYTHVAENSNKPSEQAGYEEAVKAANKLVGLYGNESAPLSKNATSSLNYGLEKNKSNLVPKGSFVFSGKQLVQNVQPYIQTYILDLKDASAKPKILFPEHQLSAMAEFKNTKDISKVFLLATSTRSMAEESDKVGVSYYDSKTKILQSFKSTKGTNERNFAWSEKKKLLAFNRMKAKQGTYLDLISLENWETVILKPDTDEIVRLIDGAYQPQWSPDGTKLVYLKSDGLYVSTLDSKDETKVVTLPQGGLVTGTSMMTLSPDASRLIWTTAKVGIISVFKIDSWSSFTITEIGKLQMPETEFYWPVFSPDGAFYAVQAIDTLKGDDFYRKNARIEIRSITNRNVSFMYPLSGFDFDQLFSDSWIETPIK